VVRVEHGPIRMGAATPPGSWTQASAGGLFDGGGIDSMVEQTPSVANGDLCPTLGTVSVWQVCQLRGKSARPPHVDMTSVHVSFTRLDTELPAPTQAHPGDAGFDLVSAEDVRLDPGERAIVPTGLAVAIPVGFAGLVLPRSGHAARHGVGVVNSPGLVDSGYRGEIKVILVNHGSDPVRFERGDRIAQLIISPVPSVELVEVSDLDETVRGRGGFGSSGL